MTNINQFKTVQILSILIALTFCADKGEAQENMISLEVQQLTSGTKHHFFGYIGQCQTIPWNASGRYVLGLEIDRIDRLPTPEEFATVILVDTKDDNKIIRLDKCHAWNPQQGTMFYWNPLKPETQFFFNDRDIKTGKVFTVLYDIEKKKRIREYKFDDTPVGNGGVAADGSAFLAINYGRLARLRLVTGYPEALDWSKDEIAPENDGIFIVDIKTGKKRLLISYRQLEKELKILNPKLDHTGLFINHTLWNRDSDRVYFFVRAGWSKTMRIKGDRVNTPCSINADGTGLTLHKQFIGGHPEWDENNILIGRQGNKQVRYDVEKKKIVGQIGTPEMFPDPEGDISVSPDGDWFVNGYEKSNKNYYAVYRRSDGAFARSEGIDKGEYSGNIRIDPAPRWNRTNDAILVPGIARNKTRQMFVIRVNTTKESPMNTINDLPEPDYGPSMVAGSLPEDGSSVNAPFALSWNATPDTSSYDAYLAEGNVTESVSEINLSVEQITFGPKNHFFGYIGHVQNIPWNRSGRYIVALQTAYQERMPNPGEVADIILIDTKNDFEIITVDQTRAWNPQQGTMLYWNPDSSETQFFFNDSDEESKEVFTVLYDISKRKRVHEYRYADTPFGNSGVAQNGGYFLGINYARMATLRPVTGYPGTFNWTGGEYHPENDGVFKVNIATGEKQLLVSFKKLADLLRDKQPHVTTTPLFINHTMWNRDDDLIKFSVRGGWNLPDQDNRISVQFTMNPDGSELTERHTPLGGHNDWELGRRLLGAYEGGMALYDYDKEEIVEKVVDSGIYPDPKGDNAVSPDATWLINGSSMGSYNIYTVFRRSDKAWARTQMFYRGRYRTGPTRIDGSPCWNRDGNQALFPALANDGTVQLFVITINECSTLAQSVNSGSFTDPRDGKQYKTISIGNQTWMAENLNYDAGSGSWEYDNDPSKSAIYGRLYSWPSAVESCPPGWHLPSDVEWQTLVEYLGGPTVAGGKMKETDTTYWNSPNIGATNVSGFSTLPAGYYFDGKYYDLGSSASFWSSTAGGNMDQFIWHRFLFHSIPEVYRYRYSFTKFGYSVRCVHD